MLLNRNITQLTWIHNTLAILETLCHKLAHSFPMGVNYKSYKSSPQDKLMAKQLKNNSLLCKKSKVKSKLSVCSDVLNNKNVVK